MASGEEGNLSALKKIVDVYRLPILLGGVSFLFIALSLTIFIKSYQRVAPITFSSDTEQSSVAGEIAPTQITVDIEGAVVNPGVYELAVGSRVDDGIEAAGGFTKDADTEAISRSMNRAAKLSDGAKLYIPRVGETETSSVSSPSSPSSLSTLININSASQSELEALSGVGPVTAGKIIGGRPYMRLEELVEKKAMSQSLFEKLKSQLVL
ncbi:MAG TPA: ComEA family DNA-binding protein [Patescibacteria group bacterium]|nr:ComEA family DNA-binding protein [Patescibacteria group bacterium]